MSVKYLHRRRTAAPDWWRNFSAWPKVPELPFYRYAKKQQNNDYKGCRNTFFLGFFIFFLVRIQSVNPFGRYVTGGDAPTWPTTSFRAAKTGTSDKKKKKNIKAWRIASRPLWSAGLIAGMRSCTSRWHNTPQASICAGQDIMKASPVVSTSLYNAYRGKCQYHITSESPTFKIWFTESVYIRRQPPKNSADSSA